MNSVDDTTKSLGTQTSTTGLLILPYICFYIHLTSEDLPSLLAVILDTNPEAWAGLDADITLREAISDLLIFINAHLAVNYSNKVCFIACHTHQAKILYPPSPGSSGTTVISNGSSAERNRLVNGRSLYRQFREVDDHILGELDHLLQDSRVDDDLESPSAVSGAFSLALAYINRVCTINEDTTMRSRILMLSVSGDISSQYIPVMNCIFAAQKKVSRPNLSTLEV